VDEIAERTSSRSGTEEPVVGATGGVDEAARVLRRLDRIETLDRERAPAAQLLGELRELVHEAEAWARASGGAREGDARKHREAAEGMR
jgi:hypothetical protein